MFAYAFKAGKWVETPRLSVRDVALLVDTEGRTIYIWHGPKSKIKDQNEAKKLLLSLRDRYSSFQFQKVGRTPTPELQAEIKRLLGSPLGMGKTRTFAILGMIIGLVGVGIGIFVIYTAYSEGVDVVTRNGGADYHPWLEMLSWGTGIGLGAFGAALLFGALAQRKYMIVTLAIGLGMGLLTILYINTPDFRPSDAEMAISSTFGLFQLLLTLMELVAFIPFTLGVIIEMVRIIQE
ncbi:MAG: hypothetical protein ACFFCS_21370 [Candidatus Hodarchaeota archaeon]